jgi:hypothetical protein
MVAIRPTYCNKIPSVAMRVVAIGKFLSSVEDLSMHGHEDWLNCKDKSAAPHAAKANKDQGTLQI